MKRLYSVVLASLIGASASAQCSSVLNNFEMKLTQTNEKTLKVQMRYHADAVAGAKQTLPTTKQLLDGLVFAISWPTSSNVQLADVKPSAAPFDVIFDVAPVASNKTAKQDNFQTFFHNNMATMPTAFAQGWTNDAWFDVATVSFTGTLAKGDFFSLVTCDYGMAHPNSFVGNSNTDPWFAVLDEAGTYQQYSPKMITELPSGLSNNCTFYPVPTSGDLNIDVETAARTSAVVKVTDMTGRLVKTVLFELEKGKNTNSINLGELPSGEYLIQLTDGKALNFSKQISKR